MNSRELTGVGAEVGLIDLAEQRRDRRAAHAGARPPLALLPLVAADAAPDPLQLPLRLLDAEAARRQLHQEHRVHLERVGQPDQVLGPIDVHLAFLPPHRPRMLEPQDVRQIALPRVRSPELAQTLHAVPPQFT